MLDVKQPRALATRESIIQAAAELFALKGYHDTKLNEVLSAAKVTTGAFFHHFQNKEDLGFSVIDRHMQRRRQLLDEIQEGLPASSDEGSLAPVFRRLDAIAEMARRRDRKGGCIIGNLCASLSDTHDAFRQRLAECFDEMASDFEPHLAVAAQEHGRALQVDTLDLARYVVTVIEGAILLARAQRDQQLIACQFAFLKNHLRHLLGT